MITYSNIQRHDNLDFGVYRGMVDNVSRFSFSFMKAERFGQTELVQETNKMRRGTLVDNILTDPAKADYNSPLYGEAKAIAAKTKEQFGPFIKMFEKQISFVADMEYMGHKIKIAGRLDFLIPKYAVIDFKVTDEKDVRALIHYMKYHEQVWHYAHLANVPKGYIFIYSTKTRKVEVIQIPIPERSLFWESKVLKFGQHQHETKND